MLSILDIGLGITLLCDVISIVICAIHEPGNRESINMARIVAALGFFIFMLAASLEYIILPLC